MTFAARSAEGAPSGISTSVSGLLWLRSTSAGRRAYLEPAAEGRPLTYRDVFRAATRWAVLLEDLDVPPGATVGIAMSDPLELAVVFLGVLAAGRTAAPFDPSSTDAELAGACLRTGPSLVVADRRPPARGRAEWVTMPPGGCFLSGTHSSTIGLLPPPGRGGVVLSTSGTTGAPKVIRLDESQLLHTAMWVARHLELTPADRGFNPLPLFHINAEVVALLATLVAGSTVVLDDRFHRRGFWDAMERRGVTWINAVPAILARLAALEGEERVPERVRFARSASAPLPVPVLERFERVTSIPVVETYGMTEAASQITANPLRGPRKPGSAGVPVGTELRVVTPERSPAPSGDVGNVVIRGPSVIRAYSSPGYEERIDPDGWLETGDLGYVDDDGYLFLVGRADDVINRGGEKIYPKEVEDVVLDDAAVTAVAVVGWDHEVLGSVPVAYLVVDGVRSWSDEQIAARVVARAHERCGQVLSRSKRPVAYHVVERLPQGATGKVRRTALTGASVVYSLLVR
ncbi:MAG: AMP-binding protein [Actinomycetota bacterium]|nr:AMP-binding protein [Actinomycetota bacterium]